MTSLGVHRGGLGWQIFEIICREAMQGSSLYSSIFRECAVEDTTTTHGDDKTSATNDDGPEIENIVELGGCNAIECSYGDIVEAAREKSSVVFYSGDPSYQLIDFVYQKDGIFYAFQATLGRKHDAKVKNIKKLAEAVGGPQFLHLYYLVPHFNFNHFKTNPVNPALQLKEKYANVNWNVQVFMIKDPNSPKRTTSNKDLGYDADSVGDDNSTLFNSDPGFNADSFRNE
jgi:hypothetical protein